MDRSKPLTINLSLAVKERAIWVGLYLVGRIHSVSVFLYKNLRVLNKGQWNSRQPVSSHYVLVLSQTSLASKPGKALRVALPQRSRWPGCPTVLFTVIFLNSIQNSGGIWGG